MQVNPGLCYAGNVVLAAIEINKFMMERLSRPGNSTFGIRVGVHSGSVVAGIVGVKKIACQIWGDTENTVARIEQNSEAGRINVSETTNEQVKEKPGCTCRHKMQVKGKGMMKMYFVNLLQPYRWFL